MGTPETETRIQFYENPSSPTTIFDGTDKVTLEETDYYNKYKEHIDIARSITPYFNLSLTAFGTQTTGNVYLKIVAADTIPEDSIAAFIGICEDSLQGTFGALNFVCRRLYNFSVSLVYPDSLDTTIVFNHTIAVHNMIAIGFIQNIDTKEIMQSITKKFEEE